MWSGKGWRTLPLAVPARGSFSEISAHLKQFVSVNRTGSFLGNEDQCSTWIAAELSEARDLNLLWQTDYLQKQIRAELTFSELKHEKIADWLEDSRWCWNVFDWVEFKMGILHQLVIAALTNHNEGFSQLMFAACFTTNMQQQNEPLHVFLMNLLRPMLIVLSQRSAQL